MLTDYVALKSITVLSVNEFYSNPDMLGGPIRRCRRVCPVIFFFISLFIVVLWRRSQIAQHDYEENQGKHIFR